MLSTTFVALALSSAAFAALHTNMVTTSAATIEHGATNNYKTLLQSSAIACRHSCRDETECVAYAYTHRDASTGSCALYSVWSGVSIGRMGHTADELGVKAGSCDTSSLPHYYVDNTPVLRTLIVDAPLASGITKHRYARRQARRARAHRERAALAGAVVQMGHLVTDDGFSMPCPADLIPHRPYGAAALDLTHVPAPLSPPTFGAVDLTAPVEPSSIHAPTLSPPDVAADVPINSNTVTPVHEAMVNAGAAEGKAVKEAADCVDGHGKNIVEVTGDNVKSVGGAAAAPLRHAADNASNHIVGHIDANTIAAPARRIPVAHAQLVAAAAPKQVKPVASEANKAKSAVQHHVEEAHKPHIAAHVVAIHADQAAHHVLQGRQLPVNAADCGSEAADKVIALAPQ